MSNELSKWNGPFQATPYPTARISPTIKKVSSSEEDVKLVITTVESKLSVINDQIAHLQKMADEIINQARRNVELHLVSCSLSKRPGNTYHLFERVDGSQFFSIISPFEWGDGFNLKYLGSFTLNPDMSWTELTSTF